MDSMQSLKPLTEEEYENAVIRIQNEQHPSTYLCYFSQFAVSLQNLSCGVKGERRVHYLGYYLAFKLSLKATELGTAGLSDDGFKLSAVENGEGGYRTGLRYAADGRCVVIFEAGEMSSREKADAMFLYELEKEAQGYL